MLPVAQVREGERTWMSECRPRKRQSVDSQCKRGESAVKNTASHSVPKGVDGTPETASPSIAFTCYMCSCLGSPTLWCEAGSAVTWGTNYIISWSKHIHATTKVGSQGSHGGRLVLSIGGANCDNLGEHHRPLTVNTEQAIAKITTMQV